MSGGLTTQQFEIQFVVIPLEPFFILPTSRLLKNGLEDGSSNNKSRKHRLIRPMVGRNNRLMGWGIKTTILSACYVIKIIQIDTDATLIILIDTTFDACHDKIDLFDVKKLAIFRSSNLCKMGSIRKSAVNLVSK